MDANVRPPLTMARVSAALAGILVLAVAVPYAAVTRLHHGRLDAADRQGAALARAIGGVLAGSPDAVPGGVELLEGPGTPPVLLDDRWASAKVLPLTRVLRSATLEPDPWGNAFLVVVNSSSPPAAWVLTAGPDGIVQTPLQSSPPAPAGDDRLFRLP